MNVKRIEIAIVVLFIVLLWIGVAPSFAGSTWLDTNGIRVDNVTLNGLPVTNNTYWLDPPFLSSKVAPNVLMVVDNSGSMNDQAYASSYDPSQFHSKKYFGYFDATKCYKYLTGTSEWVVIDDVHDATGCAAFSAGATFGQPVASGNVLNWATMRRVDVSKKLLIGGKASPRTTTAPAYVQLLGENSWGWDFDKDLDTSTTPTTNLNIPYIGDYNYKMSGNKLSLTANFSVSNVTVRPISDISVPTGWTITGATSAWDALNETSADNNTTYIRSQTSGGVNPVIMQYSDAYPSGSPPLGVIQNVTVVVRAQKNSSTTMRIQAVLNVAGTNYTSTNYSGLSTSWSNYNFSWSANPATGLDWTWADLLPGTSSAVLQGFGVKAYTTPSATNYPSITQAYIIINVTTPSGTFDITVNTGLTTLQGQGVIDGLSSDARFGLAHYNNSGQGMESCTYLCNGNTTCRNNCNNCISACGNDGTCGQGCLDTWKTTYSFTGNHDGGHIETYIDFGATAGITTSLNAMSPDTNTPLSETLYEMVRYFKQVSPYYSGNSTADYVVDQSNDPYYYKYSTVAGSGLPDMYVPCAHSFILMLTDGEPTQDRNIPTTLRDFNNDGKDAPCYNCSYASHYLDDIASWARSGDLRSDLSGTQTVYIYPIFLFGKGSTLLMDAAVAGGYEDTKDDQPNGRPDCIDPSTHLLKAGATQAELKECYRDSNGNGTLDPYDSATNPNGDFPLTYYQGDDGYELQTSIIEAISAILRRSASGTSVSVMGSSWKGEGSLFQAYFYPEKVENLRRVKWTGYFKALFVDRFGLIHEDTNNDGILTSNDDRVAQFSYTPADGTRVLYFYDKTGPDGVPDGQNDTTTPVTTASINEVLPLWDAGKLLALRSESDRTIYTSLTTTTLYDFNYDTSSGGADNSTLLRPYLRAKTDAGDTATHSVNAANLIKFIRGGDVTGWRDRKLDVGGTQQTWKLGDIVFSDPVVVGTPKESFDRLYASHDYYLFRKRWQNRRSVVYVGGNDGMLHAFNAGWSESAPTDAVILDSTAQVTMHTGVTLNSSFEITAYWNDASKPLGKELWSYIPYDLLPHLAWLADPDYLHVNYVDLITRVTDVDIFKDDADIGPNSTHPGGWGTILLVGMRFGGAEIDVQDDFGSGLERRAFKSAYYALDITDPDSPPKLLWRYTDNDLGFTLNMPAIVHVEGNWLAVFGSGPSNYRGGRAVDNTLVNTKFTQSGVVAGLGGMSLTNPLLYAIDIKTGRPQSSWAVNGTTGRQGVIPVSTFATKAFTSSPAVIDYPLDFNYDMIYVGTTYCSGTCAADGSPLTDDHWSGTLYRFDLRSAGTSSTSVHRVDPSTWLRSRLFSPDLPISTKASAALDPSGNMWVYFGTGRFLHVDDRYDASQEMFYGFKDSCYSPGCNTVMSNADFISSATYSIGLNGALTPVTSFPNPDDPPNPIEVDSFVKLSNYMQNYGTGWQLELPDTRERVTTNGFVVAGIAGFGTYTPNDDVCEFQGSAKQYFPYYLTGTSVYSPQGTGTVVPLSVSAGSGLPSAPAIHIDSHGNATLFIQSSTGSIQRISMPNAIPLIGGAGGGGKCP